MNILYAMSTKSDFERKTFCVKIAVDLFVRSWVETGINLFKPSKKPGRPLREVVSWNVNYMQRRQELPRSTSSWGRELKHHFEGNNSVSSSRPLREVVSWNKSFIEGGAGKTCRPLREVVSWNKKDNERYFLVVCRPLREVVSWNIASSLKDNKILVDLFVRSWVETFLLFKHMKKPW